MKVLLINGSPHQNGCTYTALHEVAQALQGEGIETEIVHIGNKAIRGCIACNKCRELGGRCAFDDDVANTIIEKVGQCDGLVIGSPTYFASANGSLTALLDRIFTVASGSLAYKPGACVVSARRAGTTASLDQLLKYLTINNMPVVSSRYWPMVHGNTPDEVKQDLEGLAIMRTLGRNMAWLLKSIAAGRQAGIELPAPEKRVRTNFIR